MVGINLLEEVRAGHRELEGDWSGGTTRMGWRDGDVWESLWRGEFLWPMSHLLCSGSFSRYLSLAHLDLMHSLHKKSGTFVTLSESSSVNNWYCQSEKLYFLLLSHHQSLIWCPRDHPFLSVALLYKNFFKPSTGMSKSNVLYVACLCGGRWS